MYAPPPGFFPSQAYGPSTFPSAVAAYPPEFGPFPSVSSCPSSEATPIPTYVEPNWPPPAPDLNPSILPPTPVAGVFSFSSAIPKLHQHKDDGSVSPFKDCVFQSGNNLSPDFICQDSETEEDSNATARYICALQNEKTGIDAHSVLPDYTCQGHDLTKGNNTSSPEIQDLLGELSKLLALASKITVSMGMQTTESLAAESSLVAAAAPSTSPATIAYVSPEVFGTMPQTYDFHNLNRRRVFRADGTEHSYYALPENYPLERATPEPLFWNESVGMFASNPGQQPYEEEQHASCQVPKCFSKPPFSPERPTVGVVGVYSLTIEQKPDNDLIVVYENTVSFSEDAADFTYIHVPLIVGGSIQCSQSNNKIELPSLTDSQPCCEHGKEQVHNHQLNMLQTERREEWDPGIQKTIMDIPQVVKWSSLILVNSPLSMLWDPGASAFLVTPLNNDSNNDIIGVFNVLGCNTLWRTAAPTGDEIYGRLNTAAKSQNVLPCISTRDTDHICVFMKLLPWSILSAQHLHNSSIKKGSTFSTGCTLPWNPWYAILHFHQSLWEFSMKQVTQREWDPGIPVLQHSYAAPYYIVTHPGDFTRMLQPNFASPGMCFYTFELGLTEANATTLVVLTTQCSQNICATQNSMLLPHRGNKKINHSLPKLFMQLLGAATTVQVTEQGHRVEFTLMVEMFPNESELHEQLACMPHGTSINSCEWVRHMVLVLPCWFSSIEMAKLQWDPGTETSSYFYLWLQGLLARIATEKTLSWLPIPEHTQWPSQVTSASFVWDPGTLLLRHKLLFTEEKKRVKLIPEQWRFWFNAMHSCQNFQKCIAMSSWLYCHEDINFTKIDLWLIHFLPP